MLKPPDTLRPPVLADPALYARAADGTVLIRIFQAFPDLCADVAEAEAIRRSVGLPTVNVRIGPLDLGALLRAPGLRGTPVGVIIVDGIVFAKRPGDPHDAVRLHGPGEMIGLANAPALHARSQVRLAVLDDRLTVAAQRFPALTGVVLRWALAQAAMADGLAADTRMSRVEDRLLALFAGLAERLGSVTAAGRVFELSITHLELGQSVGAARPTVSLALAQLREEGRLIQPRPSVWVLPHGAAEARPELDGAGPPHRD